MCCGGGRVEALLVKWTGNEISTGVPHLSQASSHTKKRSRTQKKVSAM